MSQYRSIEFSGSPIMYVSQAAKSLSVLASEPRLAVLSALAAAGEDGMGIAELQRRTGLSPRTVKRQLCALAKAGFAGQVATGERPIWRAESEAIALLVSFLSRRLTPRACAGEGRTGRRRKPSGTDLALPGNPGRALVPVTETAVAAVVSRPPASRHRSLTARLADVAGAAIPDAPERRLAIRLSDAIAAARDEKGGTIAPAEERKARRRNKSVPLGRTAAVA
ncbi:MAG: helix-turn-helix domain-containing protein [Hyphomicrobiaceae bacterium]